MLDFIEDVIETLSECWDDIEAIMNEELTTLIGDEYA